MGSFSYFKVQGFSGVFRFFLALSVYSYTHILPFYRQQFKCF